MQRLLRNPLTLAVAFCAAAGCATAHRSGTGPAEIVFENQSLAQADVYAIAPSGTDLRLGTVMPGHTETLRVPGAATSGGTTDIVARILGTNHAPRTGPISLAPGDRVEVRLPINQNLLTVLPARTP